MNHNMDFVLTMTGAILNDCFGTETKMPEEIILGVTGDEFNGNLVMGDENMKETTFESLSVRVDFWRL